MSMPAAGAGARRGRDAEDGPGLAARADARSPGGARRVALSIARVEAALLARGVLVLAGLVAGGAVVWVFVWPTEPLWWNAAWQIGYGQVILAATVLAAAQLAAGRARRDGMRELYRSFPVSPATRTAGHLAALAGALPASVLLAGAAAILIQARGPIGVPSPWVLAGGPLLVLAAGAAGVAVGTRLSSPLAGILGAMALLIVFTQSGRFGEFSWLFPWTTPAQLGSLPGPLTGYPPGGAHAVELAGLAVLAAVAALPGARGRTRRRMRLGAGILAVAAVCASCLVQLQPVPTAGLIRLFGAGADPVAAEHCTISAQVRYCLYPGFGRLLPAVQAPVRGVLAEVPGRPAQVLTIAQDLSLSDVDQALVHGHSRQHLALWNAELTAGPTGTAAAIYAPVGYWPSTRFALALRTAEWAVRLPLPGNLQTGCVAVDQAREAIAIWLAITATRTSAAWLQAGQNVTAEPGGGFISVAFVRKAPVILWTEPAADYPVTPGGPQTTAVGFLLARAMTSLPSGKVESVLDRAWPTWLNWRTTDAQLAAALGIPVPVVHIPPGLSRPPATGPGVAPPPSALCTS